MFFMFNNTVQTIANALKGDPCIAFFSTGKDSIVMCDLLYKNKVHFIPVFMYFVDGLSLKEGVLKAYERLWNRKIERVPHFISMNLKAGTKKYKFSSVETGVKKRFNTAWIALGYKRRDSMARRGMLAHLENGIDERNRKLYPIADWSDRQIMSYIKLNRLPLPPEYNFLSKDRGQYHDLGIPDAETLLVLKHNFRNDYDKIIAEFPQLEAFAWAAQHKGEQ